MKILFFFSSPICNVFQKNFNIQYINAAPGLSCNVEQYQLKISCKDLKGNPRTACWVQRTNMQHTA